MKKFAVACIEIKTDDVLALHIIEAETWQRAMNKSPAIWWSTSDDTTMDSAVKTALVQYRCHVAVKEIE